MKTHQEDLPFELKSFNFGAGRAMGGRRFVCTAFLSLKHAYMTSDIVSVHTSSRLQ